MIYTLAVIVAGCVGLFVFVRLLEHLSVYFPEKAGAGESAALFGTGAEEVWLTTKDKVRLNAVFVPPLAGDTEITGEGLDAPVVLYLHGNAGHLYHRFDKVRQIQEAGGAVLIVDYRGYGKSEGRPNERGLYLDAEAGYEWLVRFKGIPSERVILYGESLGGAPAVHLAVTFPVGGLICEGCFTSAADMARTLIPFLPFEILLAQQFPVIHQIRSVRAPILLLHARDDEVVPFRQARQIYEKAAKFTKVTFVPLEGGHNDAHVSDSERYMAALRSFFHDLQ